MIDYPDNLLVGFILLGFLAGGAIALLCSLFKSRLQRKPEPWTIVFDQEAHTFSYITWNGHLCGHDFRTLTDAYRALYADKQWHEDYDRTPQAVRDEQTKQRNQRYGIHV